jgi:hypothetical protein
MFILPNRPEKKNPLNDIVESLAPVAEKLVTKSHRSKLEQQLKNAGTPQDRAKAIESIMLSPHYEDKEKAVLERMFHQERQQAQQAELLQSIFNTPGAEGQGARESIGNMSDEQIAALTMQNPPLGQVVQRINESQQKLKTDQYKLIEPMEKEIYDTASQAKKSLNALDHMETLAKSGKISHPAWVAASEKLGIPWAVSDETNEYNKTMLEDMGNLTKKYGARPSMFALQTYLQSRPSIKITDEAKLPLIKRQKELAQMDMLSLEAWKQVRKENADPYTIRERHEERTNQLVDQYSEKLKRQWMKEDAQAKGEVLMEHPKYGLLNMRPDEVKAAEASGATIVR